jgi:hypothetical protein
MVEEKSDEMLNQDKSSEAMNRTSEEVVDFTTSNSATRGSKGNVFRGERAKRFQRAVFIVREYIFENPKKSLQTIKYEKCFFFYILPAF